ncbi:MAG TPA: aldo/keto reductase [Candidatus Ratteibacteria bacterium]|nr:aldo/keto reductase [Candidatus Ratteibacteria bacterium]
MIYRKFGKTGINVSILGFGAMRLPMIEKNGEKHVNEEYSIEIIQKSFSYGVNYIDSAYGYCSGESEIVVGKALKGWREKVYVSTKVPTYNIEKRDDYRRFLEEQLKKLDVDYIDFYHFHSLDNTKFEEKVIKLKLIDEAEKAKEEGLIKHISFSFHDKPEIMKKIIDTNFFETVLCQYNILDRSNEEAIEYAKKKGVGVAVMGPVGGGRLEKADELVKFFKNKYHSSPEIALKFVFSNENVSIALSGMNTIEMVEENCNIASGGKFLTQQDKKLLEKWIEERKRKKEIPCTGCRYCQPCPSGVAIPDIFNIMNYYKIYGLFDYAKKAYNNIGKWEKDERKKANACVECGQCEEKCPQKLEIRKLLKEIHNTLFN